MEITFRSNKLQKQVSTEALCKKSFGKCHLKLMQRLSELSAATNLGEIYKLPAARCHQLTNNMKGFLAVSVQQPYRLIFRPSNDPLPLNPDGGLNLAMVTSIEIEAVEDYHGD
jgi:proteic killer suppression protein